MDKKEFLGAKNTFESSVAIIAFKKNIVTIFSFILIQKLTGINKGECLLDSHKDEDILLINLPPPQPYH